MKVSWAAGSRDDKRGGNSNMLRKPPQFQASLRISQITRVRIHSCAMPHTLRHCYPYNQSKPSTRCHRLQFCIFRQVIFFHMIFTLCPHTPKTNTITCVAHSFLVNNGEQARVLYVTFFPPSLFLSPLHKPNRGKTQKLWRHSLGPKTRGGTVLNLRPHASILDMLLQRHGKNTVHFTNNAKK